MLEIRGGVRLYRRRETGKTGPKHRQDRFQGRHLNRAAFDERRPKFRLAGKQDPMGNDGVDGRQGMVVDVEEGLTVVPAPVLERATVEQVEELAKVGEDERLRLRLILTQRPNVLEHEDEGRQRHDEVVHTPKMALGEDRRLLASAVARRLPVDGILDAA